MIPILFNRTDTDFSTNGVGRLTECVSCTVTEARNGIYELELEYPISGKWMHKILNMGIVCVIHDDNHDVQPFDIYSISGPENGLVKVYAHHISYRLNNIILAPYTASSVSDAIAGISTYSVNSNPFTFTTDKDTQANFALTEPRSIFETLKGSEGSFLDVFGGGDYKFDKFSVQFLEDRGSDTGVTVRFGKNIVGITHERDELEAYSALVPFWSNGEEVVYLPEYIVTPTVPISPVVPIVKDMSFSFDEKPTVAQLRAEAIRFLDSNKPWIGSDNIKVDFIAMWQSPEYEKVAELQRVGLCDTVSVYYTDMGLVAEKTKVQRVVYNVLEERFDEIELGTISKSYVAITGEEAKNQNFIVPVATIVEQVIAALPPFGVSAEDDGNGNVTLISTSEITATDDGNGNVTILGG